MRPPQRIFVCHLLNDRSGSPKVLSQLVRSWALEGRWEIHVCTNSGTNGFLSGIPGVIYHHAWYQFRSNPWLRLVFYAISQSMLLLMLLFKLQKNDLVYVNTVLPFGAALAGKIKGCRVIYHVHESTIQPRILKWFLQRVIRLSAAEIVYVSRYVQAAHGLTQVPGRVVYNALESSFLQAASGKNRSEEPTRVLMVCSLKKYKGVWEFVQLAGDHPGYQFRLVLNATEAEMAAFFGSRQLPANLILFSAQKNIHPFYQWADVVVNLSLPDGWVETFGLTIIEGMAYGLPAIVPPVGGILEVIEEGVTGLVADARNRQQLNEAIGQIMQNKHQYERMSQAAKARTALFEEATMCRDISSLL